MKTEAKRFFANYTDGSGVPSITTLDTIYTLYTVPTGKEVQMRININNSLGSIATQVKLYKMKFGETVVTNGIGCIFGAFVNGTGLPIETEILYMGSGDFIAAEFSSNLGAVRIQGDGLEVTP